MLVIINDNGCISKYKLINNINYKGINIYCENNEYYISLSDDLAFIDNSKTCKLEIKKYSITKDGLYYSIDIYVYEDDKGLEDFDIYAHCNFLIAPDEKATVVCRDEYLIGHYLLYKNGYIESNFDISLNNKKYNHELIKENDVVEYLGIKIIFFSDYLYINSFLSDVKLTKYETKDKIIKYNQYEAKENYFIPDDIYDFELEDIKKFEKPKKKNNEDFIKSLIPSLIMSISMSMMAYVTYLNSSNKSNGILAIIIMPISSFLTSVGLPISFNIVENYKYKKLYAKAKEEYLKYLDEYEKKLDAHIQKYVASKNSHFFDPIRQKDKMFYASIKSLDYMKLSIGKITVSKNINYELSNDIQIDEKINEIINKANNINDYPLFLDLLKNRIVTIVYQDKYYFYKKYLFELAYKHHYDDLKIAIYSRNSSDFDEIYNLPHLFVKNKRMSLSSDKAIQQLDQMKLEKPLVLLILDKLDYSFTNPNIYLIYFSKDNKDIYKNSDALVEYYNLSAYLYTDKKYPFTYTFSQINYPAYFNYLGRFSSFNTGDKQHSFIDIYPINSIEYNYLNCDNSLLACFAYNKSELLSFDLHESKQGPHGLIGGCTGSGKSELIVSLLLSLCIRYSPTYLNIVLIDYKGGGIKESLSYNGKTVPHIVSSVSNLENNTLDRLIIALNNECKYRQELFKKLSTISSHSIMNIDDYINYNTSLDKVAHLLIVVDEFAELKKLHPEQIKELVSISRIGRSLGLHLILATQKPSGVIDDEIWSNCRFKICLKVFEEKDSLDLIKVKDGAYLTNPGSFILQVDESRILGQCIYSKADIEGNDPYKVSLLDETLDVYKTCKLENKKLRSQASEYCKQIIEVSKRLNLKTRPINFLAPTSKYRSELSDYACLLFGQIDDYINGDEGILAYEVDDSLLIYTSRSSEINNILNNLNEVERKTIVIASNIYTNEYILDSLTYDQNEDIEYLFNYLLENNNEEISLVIEDINCLLSYDDSYLDILCRIIKRGDNHSLSVICLCSNTSISYKLINSFKYKILIEIADNNDLSNFYFTRSKYKGNSFFYDEGPICFIPCEIEEFKKSNKKFKRIVKSIPEVINSEIIDDKYLLGYDIKTKEKVYGDKQTKIISLDNNLLKKYEKYDLDSQIYSYDTKIKNTNNFLWLGPGIFSQRLFITGLNNDLKDNEAIYINASSKYILKGVNNNE